MQRIAIIAVVTLGVVACGDSPMSPTSPIEPTLSSTVTTGSMTKTESVEPSIAAFSNYSATSSNVNPVVIGEPWNQSGAPEWNKRRITFSAPKPDSSRTYYFITLKSADQQKGTSIKYQNNRWSRKTTVRGLYPGLTYTVKVKRRNPYYSYGVIGTFTSPGCASGYEPSPNGSRCWPVPQPPPVVVITSENCSDSRFRRSTIDAHHGSTNVNKAWYTDETRCIFMYKVVGRGKKNVPGFCSPGFNWRGDSVEDTTNSLCWIY